MVRLELDWSENDRICLTHGRGVQELIRADLDAQVVTGTTVEAPMKSHQATAATRQRCRTRQFKVRMGCPNACCRTTKHGSMADFLL